MEKHGKIKEVIKYYERKVDGRFYPVCYGAKGWDRDMPYKLVLRYSSDQKRCSHTAYTYDGDRYGGSTSICEVTQEKETPTEIIFYTDVNCNNEPPPNGGKWRYKRSYVYDEYGYCIFETLYKETCDDIDEIDCIYYNHYTRDENGHIILSLYECSKSTDIYKTPDNERKYRSYTSFLYNDHGDVVRIDHGGINSDGTYLPPSERDLHRIWYEL